MRLRSGLYVHPVRGSPVPTPATCAGPKVTNPGYPGYPSLFNDILGLSTRRFLSCRGSRIAPYDVALLLYADNAVYQICTPTVKSHGPDKGTILVAAVPSSAHFRWHASLLGSLRLFEFQVPMRGSWQATRQKDVNFGHNCV